MSYGMSLRFQNVSNTLHRRNIRICWFCRLPKLIFLGMWYFWELNSSVI